MIHKHESRVRCRTIGALALPCGHTVPHRARIDVMQSGHATDTARLPAICPFCRTRSLVKRTKIRTA